MMLGLPTWFPTLLGGTIEVILAAVLFLHREPSPLAPLKS